MRPIPGVRDSSGKVNNSAPIAGTGCVMMAASENKANSWEFMKWYTSEDVQFITAASWKASWESAHAITRPISRLLSAWPWTVKERNALLSQFASLEGYPEVPGGYLTSRNIGFAMNTTYNTQADARKTLLSYIDQINTEISLKRAEFGLATQ